MVRRAVTTDGRNNTSLRGWLLLGVVFAGIVFTAATILATHNTAIANHGRRINNMEESQMKILDSLARIETKLDAMERKQIKP